MPGSSQTRFDDTPVTSPLIQAGVRVQNLLWEGYLNISSRGKVHHEQGKPDSVYYGTIAFAAIRRILKRLDLKADDVFVDLGCGKGRVLCCAARHPVKEVIGIEWSEELCAVARRNASSLRGGRAPVTVINKPVEEYEYTRGSVFYLFHPFGPQTLEQALTRIHAGLGNGQRPIRLVYVYPVYEQVLDQSGWLEEYDRWQPEPGIGLDHPVSFWKTSQK